MRPIRLSNRAIQTPPSPIRKLAYLANAARKSGLGVFPLNIGQPDIPSPTEFFDGVRLYKQEVVAYESSQGNELLCKAWADYTNRYLKVDTKPENYLITTGASEGLIFLFMTCCDPGDEIIIFDPTYANYIGFAAITGVNLIPVSSDMAHNFCLPDREKIEEQITNRTRAILLCSPNNPTGTVYSCDEVRMLLDICEENNMFLVVDETYREFVYDDLNPLSILQLAPDNKRVIVVDSLSKRFSLCGARIGCLITSNEEVMATTLNIAQARLAAPTLEQFAAAHMLTNISDHYLDSVIAEYAKRRDVLMDALQDIPGLVAHKPKGAFYLIARLPVKDSEHFSSHLLSDFSYKGKTVFLAPATGFYMHNSKGANKVRIAYILKSEEIEEAVSVIRAALEVYPGEKG